jgi:hypothetical protein
MTKKREEITEDDIYLFKTPEGIHEWYRRAEEGTLNPMTPEEEQQASDDLIRAVAPIH